ncbi:methionyl-tRNA formyltransferase [Brevibacterium jeotgali]|uniref:Methionyl-tRNA formyltransferase n=1 Tax=Brevibacterium jeotgali TaxID=1262550 RepID=A0A2H1L2M4_9MICO|nr:methionyl-tRNA formyltransferase [Brevibacterium jeotgali]TWC02943.1 methionyl-tRNA formyltransferase [Brevibacterium jeotgali]SMY10965.1 methionyl-tRNA formyltransferase [Brevibacterium jeotgali]
MRIVFAGTPPAAVPSLDALHADHEIVSVLTRPDAPVGRRRVLTPSPVKHRAQELGLPILEAARLRGDVLERLEELHADAVAVVAFGAIAGPRALATSRLGWFNLHFSLLPQYRGAAPVQRALMDGRTHSGLTVFQIDEGMDTGPVLLQRSLDLPAADAGSVLASYAEQGAGLLRSAFSRLATGDFHLTPQAGDASHAAKIDPDEARLDLSRPAAEVLGRFRGVSPSPGAWATIEGRRTKIAGLSEARPGDIAPRPGEIAATEDGVVLGTGDGAVRVAGIQPFGRPMMDASDFLRGRPDAVFDLGDDDEQSGRP